MTEGAGVDSGKRVTLVSALLFILPGLIALLNLARLAGVVSQPADFRSVWMSPAALPLLIACAGTGLLVALRDGPMTLAAALGLIVTVVGLWDLVANGMVTFAIVGAGTLVLSVIELRHRS